jgi:gp6-like head-tail connector protein
MSGSTVFYAGGAEGATLTNVFTIDKTPVDPDTVNLQVIDPNGLYTYYTYGASPALTRLDVGVYQCTQPCTTDGLWTYIWIGTGAAGDVSAGTWRVLPDTIGQWYTSREEIKSRLGINDTTDDFEIDLAVQAAARWIEGRCGRHFYQMQDTRTYVPESIWTAHIDDVVSVSQLAVDPQGTGDFSQIWTQGVNYELAVGERRYNRMASGEPQPYREIRVIGGGSVFFPFVWPLYRQDRIQVTGVFGWPAVPPAITQAALLLASDLFKLKDAPFGVQGMADFGMVHVQAGSQVEYLLQRYIDPSRKVGV